MSKLDRQDILDRLNEQFPKLYVKDIEQYAIENNYDIEKTGNILTELNAKKQLPRLKVARKPKNITKMFRNQIPPKKYEICSCCCDDSLMEDNTITCSNGHSVCAKCFVCYSSNQLYQQKTTKFGCINCNQTCTGHYEYEKFAHAYTEQLKKEYENVQNFENFVEILNDPNMNIKQCSHCQSYIDIGIFGGNEMVCYTCGKETCLFCNEKSHFGKPCNSEKTQNLEDEQKTNEITIKCTRCFNRLFKDGGCNLIKCVCGKLYCVICKESVSGHNHFRKDGCNMHD